MRGFKHLKLSMENDDPTDNPPAAADDIGLAEVGTDIAAHVEDQAAVENDQVQVETAQAATDGIEELQEMATEAYKAGGLNAQAAAILIRGVSHLAVVGNLDKKDRLNSFSVENFENAAVRRQQTKYTVEGIGDMLKDAWTQIAQWWGNFVNWVAEKWNQYFGAYEKLKKSAEALAKQASDKSSAKNESGDSKMEKEALAKKLAIGTSVPTDIHSTGPAGLEKLVKALNYSSTTTDSGGICEVLLDVLSSDDKEVALKMVEPTDFTVDGTAEKLAAIGIDAKDGTKIKLTEVLPGNVVWYARLLASEKTLSLENDTTAEAAGAAGTKPEEAGAEAAKKPGPLNEEARKTLVAVASCTAGIVASDKNMKPENIKSDVPVLTPSQVEDMAKKVGEVCGTLLSYRSRADKRKKVADKFKEQVTKIANRVKNADSSEEKSLNAKKTVAQAGSSLVDFGSTKVATQIMTLSHALLSVGKDSLAKYK